MSQEDNLFPVTYGRQLVEELKSFVHLPYIVVTMEDLWPSFQDAFDDGLATCYFVRSLERDALAKDIEVLPQINAVIGLGGGRALDVAKCLAWRRRIPLFQLPTALTSDAAFGHRFAVRIDGKVHYMGWAVPEAVYIDLDVLEQAPPELLRSGIGDVLCYHTAGFDWKLAHERQRNDPRWPYDERLVCRARRVLGGVVEQVDAIREGTDVGIRTLVEALRFGGAAYHNWGWNPRPIEGVEHFFFYHLEYLTRRPFIHGQPVCLGVYLGALLQDNHPDDILSIIHRGGVDIRPEAMGVTWDEVATALKGLRQFVEDEGWFYTIANEVEVTDAVIDHARERIESVWNGDG